ncbi:hypothetical protein N656DRAFT_412739 [Canariomyces notabilis]|uniref:Uncharacterized protein n=1 Tax=Canariomyces notabilis TaxID=2074819 RepID=A0AAN6T9C3_9PEZI|nr:hypothetical protein N656DRAFT_412739 [Canariomyces arenarius]
MCTSEYIVYTCGCRREMEFIQCPRRQGTNVKCARLRHRERRVSTNYCSRDLVRPDAEVKYMNRMGEVVEEPQAEEPEAEEPVVQEPAAQN